MKDKYTQRPLLFHVNTQKRERTQAAIAAGISGPSRPRLRASLFCGCILGYPKLLSVYSHRTILRHRSAVNFVLKTQKKKLTNRDFEAIVLLLGPIIFKSIDALILVPRDLNIDSWYGQMR